jgi:hypothetical protein
MYISTRLFLTRYFHFLNYIGTFTTFNTLKYGLLEEAIINLGKW